MLPRPALVLFIQAFVYSLDFNQSIYHLLSFCIFIYYDWNSVIDTQISILSKTPNFFPIINGGNLMIMEFFFFLVIFWHEPIHMHAHTASMNNKIELFLEC